MVEFSVVKESLEEWGVKEQVLGMVFDTTASNSGEYSGACRYLEEWLGFPILWHACRRHIAELHLGTAVRLVMGNRSSHLGIHKQTNACLSIPRSQTVFYHFKICRNWEL